jgi:hypothetical protein
MIIRWISLVPSKMVVRGGALLDPVLEIELKIRADGLAPGVAAMILASCHVQG